MKPIFFSTLLLGILSAATAPDTTPAAAAGAANSAALRQQINALLKVRRKPEPLPVEPPNPFAQTGGGSGGTAIRDGASGGAPNPAPDRLTPARDDAPATSAELLARFASRLKITGLIRLKDQVHVIINDTPWREGDLIIVDRGPRMVQLQVARIQPGLLTLRLEDAELVLKF